MDRIDIPRLRQEVEFYCENCPICGMDLCGQMGIKFSYGYGVCGYCVLGMEMSETMARAWIGPYPTIDERLDTMWSDAREMAARHPDDPYWAVPEVDFDALEKAIDLLRDDNCSCEQNHPYCVNCWGF